MIVKGNSSLVSMKTRCKRAAGLLPERGTDRVAPCAEMLALGGDCHDVLDPDPAVATARQAAESEHAISAEPVNELAADTEDVGSLGGGDFVLGAQYHDARAAGHVVEHRAHGSLHR